MIVSEAKRVVYCDACKSTVKFPTKEKGKLAKDAKPLPPEPMPLEATFMEPSGEETDCHFCDEGCLRAFLNERGTAKAASYELDVVKGGLKRVITLI